MGTGVKMPGRETDHTPPSNAEVMNESSYNIPHPHGSVPRYSNKHRDNFALYYIFIIIINIIIIAVAVVIVSLLSRLNRFRIVSSATVSSRRFRSARM
jgi:hypothetical protein